MSGKKNKDNKGTAELMHRDADFPVMPFSGATPFSMMRRFMDDMDRLFQDFNGIRRPGFATDMPFRRWMELEKALWSPKIEVLKDEGNITVRADLPGMKRDDITVELIDGALTLSGERKKETEEKKEGFYRSEVNYGSFLRSIPLPDGVKLSDATATFENGVLEVKIAVPVAESSGRKIEIKAAETEPPKVAAAAP